MKSQTPTWAIIVAILMMLVGGCGIKNDVQSINIRSFLSMKDKIIDNIETKNNVSVKISTDSLIDKNNENEVIELDSGSISGDQNIKNDTIQKPDSTKSGKEVNVKEMFNEILDLPEETINLIIKFGYISLIFSFLFIIGGLFLLIKKPFSIRLAYSVIAANIIFSIVKWSMLSGKGGALISIGNSVGAAFTIFISLIIFIVILSCDKSHYEEIYMD